MFTERINPLHSCTFIWQQSNHIKILWLTLLMFQNAIGEIFLKKWELIRIANISESEFSEAISFLTGNSDKNDVALIDTNNNKIKILFDHYEMARKRRKNTAINKPKWKENSQEGLNTYLAETKEAFFEMYNDVKWIAALEKEFPGVDIVLHLEKQFNQYWGTHLGWNNKRRKATIKIDWYRTIEKSLQYLRRKF